MESIQELKEKLLKHEGRIDRMEKTIKKLQKELKFPQKIEGKHNLNIILTKDHIPKNDHSYNESLKNNAHSNFYDQTDGAPF